MHEIRKNNAGEEEIITLAFKLEPVCYILYAIGFLVCCGIALAGFFCLKDIPNSNTARLVMIIIGGVFALWILLSTIFNAIGMRKSKVIVTNQRIYGKYGTIISMKSFSYRLDQIENVEVKNFLGSHSIALDFVNGKGPMASGPTSYKEGYNMIKGCGVLNLSHLVNYNESYESLTKALISLKTATDLHTDIEMAKVDVESKKADAMERFTILTEANQTKKEKDNDYIDELKRLKELLDQGIITKEEFEKEKKEILDNNH